MTSVPYPKSTDGDGGGRPALHGGRARAALVTLLEVLELETGDRRQRREDRLRRAAKLPAGKTWDVLDITCFPVKLQQQLEELATARATARYSAGRVFRRLISEHPAAFAVLCAGSATKISNFTKPQPSVHS